MITRMCLVGLLLVSSLGAAKLDKAHRIENAKPGVCMWSCIESVGRQRGITAVNGLREKVLGTGIGRDQGAEDYHILYWAEQRGFQAKLIQRQPAAGLRYRTECGQHVIAIVTNWYDIPKAPNKNTTHAVVVLDVTAKPEQHPDGNGRPYLDHWVTYFDPNKPEHDLRLPWSAFGARYLKGYVIEPLTTSLTPKTLDAAIAAMVRESPDVHLPTLRRMPPEPEAPLLVRRRVDSTTTAPSGSVGTAAP